MKTWTVRTCIILLAAGLAVLANSCMPFDPIGAAGVGDLKIYWVVGNLVKTANLDGSGQQTVRTQSGVTPSLTRVVVDKINEKIYYADNGDGQLWWANLDGSGAAMIASGFTFLGLAVDPFEEKLYVARQGAMRELASYNLDGSNLQIINSSLPGTTIYDMKLDRTNSRLYFTDGSEIYRCATTPGGSIERLTTMAGSMRGIALDVPANTIYWTNGMSIFKSAIGNPLSPQFAADISPDSGYDLELDPHTNTLYYSISGAIEIIYKISTSGGTHVPVITMASAYTVGDLFLDLWP